MIAQGRAAFAAGLLLAGVRTSGAEPCGLPPELLARLKSVGVFVQSEGTAGTFRGTGTLVGPRSAVTHPDALGLGVRNQFAPRKIALFFRDESGKEQAVSGRLTGLDSDSGLAYVELLQAPPVKEGSITPLIPPAEILETLPVHVIGSPFGRELAGEGQQRPALRSTPVRCPACGTTERARWSGTNSTGRCRRRCGAGGGV
jgi:hypothetical protein